MSELVWGPILAGYLFLGGLAGGAYVVGALADLFKGEDYEVLSKSGTLVSLVSIILGLVLLVLDLKRFEVAPLVILNAYRRFPGSILTVGTWIITGFTAISLVTAVLWFLGGNWLVRKLIDVVGIVLGIATAAYTGVLLSFSRGVPFWSSPFLPWLFVVSGVLTGLMMAMLLIPIAAAFMPKAFNDFMELFERRAQFVEMIGHVEKYCVILTVAEIALVALYMGTTPTTGILLTGAGISLWFYTYIILGLILPLGIGYYNEKLKHSGRDTAVVLFALAGQIMGLAGGLILRYVVLTGGQLIF
jgi:formate-dependent nitrite reductase membrane component NrfD